MDKLPPELELDLPDWGHPSAPAPLPLADIVALCEKMLPYWNAQRFTKPPPPLPDRPFSLGEE